MASNMTFKTNLIPHADNSDELGSSSAGWKIQKLNIPTTSNGSTFGPGSNGQALLSNGSSIYWGAVAPTITSSTVAGWGFSTTTGTVTSVAASGSSGITISGSPVTTSGTITVGINMSTAINTLGEGTSPAQRNDYIVAQYAGGGTTTTTYHRRKLSNIFAALNSEDITSALGYTPTAVQIVRW